jgi:CDP-diacylglycerol--serine O-phosphatidyltransferase
MCFFLFLFFFQVSTSICLAARRCFDGLTRSQVSFGVSPAAAAFSLGLRTPVDHLLLAFFVLCGLTRLARFNVTAALVPKDATGKAKFFEGTPIPMSLGIVQIMAYWVYKGWTLEQVPLGLWLEGTAFEFHPVVAMFILHGCLMVSKTLHVPKP